MDPVVEDRPLRRVVDELPTRLWIVAIVGFWERFTFWGVTIPWRTSLLSFSFGSKNVRHVNDPCHRKLHGTSERIARHTRRTGSWPGNGNQNILRVLHLLLCHTALLWIRLR